MSTDSVTEAVLAAVAEAEGVPVESLRESLYEAIDPESLDKLFRSGHAEVSFDYMGYIVTVNSELGVELVSIDDR
ncbi:HalOD1 output domain-containing protein [Haloferax sp. YSSS75]|uniref:HalOD1 output domain-containing protein n=1 Tax=Haloferax sp. YSSS75 TaxID=3388564 RepID=UPI00398D14EA